MQWAEDSSARWKPAAARHGAAGSAAAAATRAEGWGVKETTTEADSPQTNAASLEQWKTRKHRESKQRGTSTYRGDRADPCRNGGPATGYAAAAMEEEYAVAKPGSEAASCTDAWAYSTLGSTKAAWNPAAGWLTEDVKDEISDPSRSGTSQERWTAKVQDMGIIERGGKNSFYQP